MGHSRENIPKRRETKEKESRLGKNRGSGGGGSKGTSEYIMFDLVSGG